MVGVMSGGGCRIEGGRVVVVVVMVVVMVVGLVGLVGGVWMMLG